MHTPSDRPPILRFLILFAGLLAAAVALAAMWSSVDTSNGFGESAAATAVVQQGPAAAPRSR